MIGFAPRFTITNAIAAGLTAIERARGFLEAAVFYEAIRGAREQVMDLTGWLELFVRGLAIQLGKVKARGEVAIRADLVAREHGLNGRQAATLDQALANGRLTLGELEQRLPETNRRSLQRDLRAMVDKGLLREAGSGPTDPTRHYVPAEL